MARECGDEEELAGGRGWECRPQPALRWGRVKGSTSCCPSCLKESAFCRLGPHQVVLPDPVFNDSVKKKRCGIPASSRVCCHGAAKLFGNLGEATS